jgi:hypothetical protein
MSAIHGGQNCSCISDGQEPECLGGHGWPREARIPAIHGHKKTPPSLRWRGLDLRFGGYPREGFLQW